MKSYSNYFYDFMWSHSLNKHDDVIKWKHFPRYWPFVRGIHRSPVNSPAQRPVTRSFDVFFDLCLIKQLSKHSRGWWFETLSRPLWCHCNGICEIGRLGINVRHVMNSPMLRFENTGFEYNVNTNITNFNFVFVIIWLKDKLLTKHFCRTHNLKYFGSLTYFSIQYPYAVRFLFFMSFFNYS